MLAASVDRFIGHSFIIFIGFVNYFTNNLDSNDPLCHNYNFAEVHWHTPSGSAPQSKDKTEGSDCCIT